jgi:hypothetical protein
MNRRRTLLITATTVSLLLLGGLGLHFGSSDPEVEIRHREIAIDKDDVRTIRQIVSHERWAIIRAALRRRDPRLLRESIRHLAFGRLLWVGCGWWVGSPAVVAVYENTDDKRRSIKYALRPTRNCWKYAGYTYYDFSDEARQKDPRFLD